MGVLRSFQTASDPMIALPAAAFTPPAPPAAPARVRQGRGLPAEARRASKCLCASPRVRAGDKRVEPPLDGPAHLLLSLGLVALRRGGDGLLGSGDGLRPGRLFVRRRRLGDASTVPLHRVGAAL